VLLVPAIKAPGVIDRSSQGKGNLGRGLVVRNASDHRGAPQVIPVPEVHTGVDLKSVQFPGWPVERMAQAECQSQIWLHAPTVLRVPLILVCPIISLYSGTFGQGAEAIPGSSNVVLSIHLKAQSPQVRYIKVGARAAAAASERPA